MSVPIRSDHTPTVGQYEYTPYSPDHTYGLNIHMVQNIFIHCITDEYDLALVSFN